MAGRTTNVHDITTHSLELVDNTFISYQIIGLTGMHFTRHTGGPLEQD